MFRDIDYEKWRGRIIRAARWAWRWRFLLAILWVIAVFGTEILLLKIPQTNAAYTIANSARFIPGNSDYLSRTFATSTNNEKWTWSGWFKRGALGGNTELFAVGSSGTESGIQFLSDYFEIYQYSSGAYQWQIDTSALFRDPSAWVHLVVAADYTQTTPSNRIKVYIDGVQVASFTTATYPANQNYLLNSAIAHYVGAFNGGKYYDGYLADVYFIDGQQLAPTSFGKTDANGYWRPIAYTGTYGTNGFHLNFSNGASLGTDSSGNANNFTVNGLTAADQVLDSPTDGFATGNPIAPGGGTYSSGNLTNTGSATSTVFMSTGKWYWEVTANAPGVTAGVVTNAGVASTASVPNGTTIGFWFDADAGTLASTTDGATLNGTVSGLTGGRFAYATGGSNTFNYGQGGQTGLTSYSSAGGYFKYNPVASLTSATTTAKFTSSGSWTAPTDVTSAEMLIVAGGGGGGGRANSGGTGTGAGGGGGGGIVYTSATTTIPGNVYTVTVGAGGSGATSGVAATNGGNSSVTGYTIAVGGGRGGNYDVSLGYTAGGNGGSGGGGPGLYPGGSGTSGQGNNGAAGGSDHNGNGTGYPGAGGGGALAASVTPSGLVGGNGGAGVVYSTTGSTVTYGCGGAGASYNTGDGTAGCGNAGASGGAGTANTGGGGGGGDDGAPGGAGGSGIVVIAYTTSLTTSGYEALSTANLPAPTIAEPNKYFNAFAYTGTGAAQNIAATASTQKTIYLTSGTTWTVPTDWNSSNNAIEVIGGGGGGSAAASGQTGAGGGGGAYSKISNLPLTPGTVVEYSVGAGGGSASGGGDTFFCSSSSNCASISGTAVQVGAKGGGAGSGTTGGSGGASGSGVGTVENSGGAGGNGIGGAVSNGGGGGGGAGGPNGAGASGGSEGSGTGAGSGGGGNGGGSAGAGATGATNGTGGNGGNNYSGSGGGAGGNFANGTAGTAGGGGGGAGGNGASGLFVGGAGGNGTEWDSMHGSGGGGGGSAGQNGSTGEPGAAGGLYGGGGSGGGFSAGSFGAGGSGAQGIIVIKYTPTVSLFQPDLVWLKDRTTTNNHGIFDSVQGATKYWSSNSTAAETTDANSLTAFLTNGFSLGSTPALNTSGDSYVSWLWKKAPTTDGVDVVTYTGDNTSNRNINHNLGVAPDTVIVKSTSTTGAPYIWHIGMSGTTYYNSLNAAAAQSNVSTPWGTGNFSSTQFMVTNDSSNNLNASGVNYVAYLFAPVSGFSSLGTFTGNGSADGPFVYTGFEPRYLLIKARDQAYSFYIYDTARNPYNTGSADYRLVTDGTYADATSGSTIDFLSNGFKLRDTYVGGNQSGQVYYYIAFADEPFYYSAQPAASAASSNAGTTFLIGMPY